MRTDHLEHLRLQPEQDIEAQENFKQQSLALLREQLAGKMPEGYPAQAQRYFRNTLQTNQAGTIILPHGPWIAGNETPNIAEHIAIRASGARTDTFGRPVHPWAESMAADPTIGLLTGRGELWFWGACAAADAAVFSKDYVLMVQRAFNGSWCLPGGFIDPGESAKLTAIRETFEESHTDIPEEAPAKRLYAGPVADIRNTANAWITTELFAFELDDDAHLQKPIFDSNESLDAQWVRTEVAQEMQLYGSHNALLELALRDRA